MKIGIIKEGKTPVDHRVPFTPQQCREIMERFPEVKVKVESSAVRVFNDEEYRQMGIEVSDDIRDCDVLMGVKEVPIADLIPDKTYFFFSHTIKEQAYNRPLLQSVVQKNIRLIDYEPLTDEEGHRVVAFGRWAGIVGAYNALWTYGQRYRLFHLPRAHELYDLEDLKKRIHSLPLPDIKIAITGGGRVAKGAMEVLHAAQIHKVSPAEFLEDHFDQPVFTQLNTRDYNKSLDGSPFQRKAFYQHPEKYVSDFLQYAYKADMLIACAYWDPAAPVLFKREDIMDSHFKIKVIADVTCDIEGSIPTTKRASTIADPIYDYNPSEDKIETPLSDEANLTVMAVDNLPCELPRDASESFGRELMDQVLPALIGKDEKGMIARATITENGQLGPHFEYLEGYLRG
jgi:alanine dehydrogenase